MLFGGNFWSKFAKIKSKFFKKSFVTFGLGFNARELLEKKSFWDRFQNFIFISKFAKLKSKILKSFCHI